jgi:hypothetical protein
MVQTFATNANNDIFIDANGNLVVLTGNQAILAACVTACRAQLGEMVLATTLGLPNFQVVWVGVPNLPLWQSYLLQTLQAVEGVTQASNITIAVVNHTLNFTADITTIYGITTTITG